jgi:hypothetical protein
VKASRAEPDALAGAANAPPGWLQWAPMRNGKAIGAFLCAFLAVALLVAGAAVPRFVEDVDPLRALVVVPPAAILALAAIALARRARFEFQRTLGRVGGNSLAGAARILSVAALLVAVTATLAVGVFAVLDFVLA